MEKKVPTLRHPPFFVFRTPTTNWINIWTHLVLRLPFPSYFIADGSRFATDDKVSWRKICFHFVATAYESSCAGWFYWYSMPAANIATNLNASYLSCVDTYVCTHFVSYFSCHIVDNSNELASAGKKCQLVWVSFFVCIRRHRKMWRHRRLRTAWNELQQWVFRRTFQKSPTENTNETEKVSEKSGHLKPSPVKYTGQNIYLEDLESGERKSE